LCLYVVLEWYHTIAVSSTASFRDVFELVYAVAETQKDIFAPTMRILVCVSFYPPWCHISPLWITFVFVGLLTMMRVIGDGVIKSMQFIKTIMAKKRKTKSEKNDTGGRGRGEFEELGFWSGLQEETRNSIIGILLFIVSVILVIAATGNGGFLGGKVYQGIHFLFGIGYYVLPLLFSILAVNFFRAGGHNIATPALVAGPFFLLSSLGLLALMTRTDGTTGLGGFVGYYIMSPLATLFAPVLTAILLFGVFVIAILILFDTPLRLGFIFSALSALRPLKRDELDSDGEPAPLSPEETTEVISLREEPKTEEPAPKEEVVPEEEAPKPSLMSKLTGKKKVDEMPEDPFRYDSALHQEYTPPPISLLANDKGKPGFGDIKANANVIKRTLQNFGISVEMDEVSVGPSITRYALKPAEGVRLSKIVTLQRDLELALAAAPVRIEAPIPGKSLVGIEMPNTTKSMVGLGTLLSDVAWASNPNPLFVPLGKGISGLPQFMNIAKMPHVLVAGTTGSGKSVTMHTIITSLLYRNSPERLRFLMVDPKRVELTLYNGIPHLLTPVVTDAKKAILTLKWATKEMDRRYDVLQEMKTKDIASYHKNILEPALEKFEKQKAAGKLEEGAEPELPELMPYIVVIVDELADLMSAYPRELEAEIVRLAQMARAVGIHVMIATQSPRVNVITGLIKANIPARIALQVASQIDSRTILDTSGAENLLGAGDMLYLSSEMPKPVRLQSAYISEQEVKNVVKYLKDHYDGTLGDEINVAGNENRNAYFGGIPDDALTGSIDGDGEEDDKYDEAKAVVLSDGKASTSYLQRRLGLGYARAAKIMDMLEKNGVIGPADGAKPRTILMRGDSDSDYGRESE
jgi:DNA segregation ATPase FtsK/SpoIIIE, S-DNA-T family